MRARLLLRRKPGQPPYFAAEQPHSNPRGSTAKCDVCSKFSHGLLGLLAGAIVAASFVLTPSFAQNGAPIPPPAGAAPATGKAGGGRGRGKALPARPTPHWPDGHVNLGPLPGEKGLWEGNAGATLATNPPGGLDNPRMYLATNLKISEVPFQ